MRKQRGRKRWLSVNEGQRLIALLPSHLKPLIDFAVDTGGRRSELLGLDWRNVDIDRRFITFIETKNGEDRAVPNNWRKASGVMGWSTPVCVSAVSTNP